MAEEKLKDTRPFIERAISAISPTAGANRSRARLNTVRYETARRLLGERKYDGASAGRRTDGWIRTGSGANNEVRAGLVKLRNASRELVRNNPWAGKAISVIGNHVVGDGIDPYIQGSNKSKAKKLADAYRDWANSTDCDVDGRHNMAGLQSLAIDAIVESGEVLVRRRRMDSSAGMAIPLKIQVLEGDFIDSTKEGKRGDNIIIQGVEFEPDGTRAGYWLFKSHPGENITMLGRSLKSEFVPASEIIHVYLVKRPGQVRGVPWGHAVVLKLKDLDDAHDAYLWRQKLAACFMGFIHDLEAGDGSDGDNDELFEKLEPGLLQTLPDGKGIEFANPPQPVGFDKFSDDQLYAIASGFGITFESLTGKLKGVNFLSGRMGQLDMMKNVAKWQTRMFVPLFCSGVFDWFAEAAEIMGMDQRKALQVDWVLPIRDMIDPQKEYKILQSKVRSGMPLFDAMRGSGYANPEQTLKRKAEENELLDDLGLVLDIDPRRMSAAGNAINAEPEPAETVPQTPEDDED